MSVNLGWLLVGVLSVCFHVHLVTSGAQWWGRLCCELSLTTQCKNICQRAKSREELANFCQSGNEMAIFNCLDKHEEGQRCCQSARSSRCRAVCKSIFIQDYLPTQSQLNSANTYCDPQVAACMQNYTKATPLRKPTDSLPCCNHSESIECREACHNALSVLTAEEAIVDEVSKYCGLPNPTRKLWQCFLRRSTNSIRQPYNNGGSIEVTGIDGAKLQCCAKATTLQCRELCTKTYSRGWTETVNDFHNHCAYHPQERDLNLCLEDVEERCQLGCSGLSFCTNFNHRPTELFRSCNLQADQEARSAINLWKRGMISMPAPISHDIPVKNITTCQPRKWQAIACTLQIKPCHSKRRANWICKSDCIDILSECLDTTRVKVGVTPHVICNMLSSPDETAPCISLAPYLVESHHQVDHREVTTPCNPNPCNMSQICEVSRRKCSSLHSCPQYICKPGCPMGEVVTQLVPYNSYVKIPKAPLDGSTDDCYVMCRCGQHGRVYQCTENVICVKKDAKQCLLKSGMIHSHGTKFNLGCNKCVCHYKETICTTRNCPRIRASSEEMARYTGLPCNCAAHYSPVCGLNGQTYPNFCLARCSGLNASQADLGSCSAKDPCSPNPCIGSDRCIRSPQVCLSHRLSPGECKQYECIRQTEACEKHSQSPVCNSRGEELPSLCQLFLSREKTLAYRGHCKKGCRHHGQVCGVNGETYSSECSAWAGGVPADYDGTCRAVGQLNYSTMESSCPNVTCSFKSHVSHCKPIVPPGACCPVCAGEIRILLSQRQVTEAWHKGHKVTVADVLSVLRLQVSVAECDVFAYPSIEGDLVVLVAPVTMSPTPLQVNACMSETEKLGSLITSGSPIITTFVSASTFASAEVRISSTFNRQSSSALGTNHGSSSHPGLTWTCAIALTVAILSTHYSRSLCEGFLMVFR